MYVGTPPGAYLRLLPWKRAWSWSWVWAGGCSGSALAGRLTTFQTLFYLLLLCCHSSKSVRRCMSAKSFWSCLTLWSPVDCSLPGSSVHGILQARILEWVAMPSSRDLPDPGIQPTFLPSPALADKIFTTSATWEAQVSSYMHHLRKESCFIIAF